MLFEDLYRFQPVNIEVGIGNFHVKVMQQARQGPFSLSSPSRSAIAVITASAARQCLIIFLFLT